MGFTASADISFGYTFDEGTEFPWDDDKYDGDSDEWWRDVNGFKNDFEMFDEKGEWLPGFENNQEKRDQHYNKKCDWDKANPKPFELVQHGSYEYRGYVIAVPGGNDGSIASADWDAPNKFDPAAFKRPFEMDIKALQDFLEKFEIKPEDQGHPRWWFSCFYG